MNREIFDFCVGTADLTLQRQIITILSAAGFRPVGVSPNVPELLRTLRSVQPWLVIVDTKLPPGNVEQLASLIEEVGLAAAIYVGPYTRQLELYPRLSKPLESAVLAAVADALCLEFAHKQKMRSEISKLKQSIAERREIEKAKGILMEKHSLSEEEAYRYLRSRSMDQRITLVNAARRILLNI